jgi:hypothetical protein
VGDVSQVAVSGKPELVREIEGRERVVAHGEPVVILLRRLALEHHHEGPGVDIEHPHAPLAHHPVVVERVDALELHQVGEDVVGGALDGDVAQLLQPGLHALLQRFQVLRDDVLTELVHPDGEVGGGFVRLRREHRTLAVLGEFELGPVARDPNGVPPLGIAELVQGGEPRTFALLFAHHFSFRVVAGGSGATRRPLLNQLLCFCAWTKGTAGQTVA